MIMKELILIDGRYKATIIIDGERFCVFGETQVECIVNAMEVYPDLVVPSHFYI